MSDQDLLTRHVFCFNPGDNCGESLMLTTEFFDNGDAALGLPGGVYSNQQLDLQSYCNSASFCLVGAKLTPEILRDLADQLEEAEQKARSSLKGE